MYFYADDPAFAVSVIVSRGASTDADQAQYIERFLDFDKRHREREAPTFILVAEASSEAPDAKWRQRIADASRNISPSALCVFVIESTLARGIVTAINWIRPPPYAFAVVSNMREATDWVDHRRPGVRMIIQRLFVEAQTAAQRDAVKPTDSLRAGGR